MKLQRQVTRVVQGTEYAKWVITVPPQHIERLGWKEGEQLDSKVGSNALVIEKGDPKPKSEKMSYEQFRDGIAELLKANREGLSWTEIKRKLRLPQKVPNNLWVRTMERDIGLLRKFDNATGKTVWRLK